MKKTIAFLLACLMAAFLCTCSDAESAPAETPVPEAAEATAEVPQTGYYAGAGMYARYADGRTEQFSAGMDMSLLLNGDGTAVLNLAGNDWQTIWENAGIYNEFGTLGLFDCSDGHLSFSWEGGDGYYTYVFDYQGENAPAEPVSSYFDMVDEEPFFVFSGNGQHYGYTDDYWCGCSVWCAVRDFDISARASSTLAPQGQYSYGAENITSGERNNAWVEGADGYGIDEYFEITRRYAVSDGNYGVDFCELCIVNGYARTPETWTANSRVKELKFCFNDEYVDSLFLEDTMEPQYFDLSQYHLHADSGADSFWRFEIVSVYEGEKYEDTAITGIEIQFWTPNHSGCDSVIGFGCPLYNPGIGTRFGI